MGRSPSCRRRRGWPPGGTLLYLPLRAGVPPPPLAVPSATMLFLQKIDASSCAAPTTAAAAPCGSRAPSTTAAACAACAWCERRSTATAARRARSRNGVCSKPKCRCRPTPPALARRRRCASRSSPTARRAPRSRSSPSCRCRRWGSASACTPILRSLRRGRRCTPTRRGTPRFATLWRRCCCAVVSDDGWLRKRLGSWMPRRSECRDPFFLPLFDALESGLRESRVLTARANRQSQCAPGFLTPSREGCRAPASTRRGSRGALSDDDAASDVLGDEEWLRPQFVTNRRGCTRRRDCASSS